MEICDLESHVSMEIALKEAGFTVEKTVKQGKKTVITVTRKLPQGEGSKIGMEEGGEKDKLLSRERCIRRFRLEYSITSFVAFFGGVTIYVFLRNMNNMIIFQFFPKPAFLSTLNAPLQAVSIWTSMFVFNLPYGLWSLSGLLLIRAIWLQNSNWRSIYGSAFIALVMLYVVLKLPGIVPGTFDILDLVFMGFFAFLESLIFNVFIRRSLR